MNVGDDGSIICHVNISVKSYYGDRVAGSTNTVITGTAGYVVGTMDVYNLTNQFGSRIWANLGIDGKFILYMYYTPPLHYINK
jgi:hypothetical protein